MLIASDPIIASKRRSHHEKRKPFSKEVLEMLDVPLIEAIEDPWYLSNKYKNASLRLLELANER